MSDTGTEGIPHEARISFIQKMAEQEPGHNGIDEFVVEAAKEFLPQGWSEEPTRQWLHELRDYIVRYSWTSGFMVTAIGIFIDCPGRCFPAPPEGDDTPAWRARWAGGPDA